MVGWLRMWMMGCALVVVGCGGDDETRTDAALEDGAPPTADALVDASPDGSIPPLADATVDGPVSTMPCDVIVPLDGTKPTMCDQGWSENGVGLSFVNTTSEDCTDGRCSFDPTHPDQLALYPGRLAVDLSGLDCTISAVEFDIHDYCGVGCTRAFLYGEGADSASAMNPASGMHTLRLAGITNPTRAAVSSCEGFVTEIRIR